MISSVVSYTIGTITPDFSCCMSNADIATGSVSGRLYNDLNGDGQEENGEGGLFNRTVQLEDSDGILESTTTNSAGKYLFTDLPVGTYLVRAALPTGWIYTTSNPSSITITSGTLSFGNDF